MPILSPVLYAIVLWWFSTGLIMLAYDRAQLIMRFGFFSATIALFIAFAGVYIIRNDASAMGVYIAVTCGVTMWGWQLTSYYYGFITGIQPEENHANISIPQRFWKTLGASIYHELFALSFAVIMIFILWSAENRWTLWMYLALWLLHSSAKLNVFFGVRNFRMEFLPSHMHHLDKYLLKAKNNAYFPVSIVVSTSIALALLYKGVQPTSSAIEQIGCLVVATMMGLGILEHWLMILPLPAALWGFGIRMLPEHKQPAKATKIVLPSNITPAKVLQKQRVKRDTRW